MATAAPDGTLTSSLSGLQGILDKIIGSKTVGTDQRNLNTQQNTTGSVATTGTDTTTGNVDTTTAQLQQLLSQLTGTTNTTTKNTADTTALKQVFAQQQGGITPDALAAIFREGSKAAPQLVATTANALGARPDNNSALAASLKDLNTNLVSQAATINQQMLRDSAGTAGQIATATGGTQTTGQTTQTTDQSSNTSGTSSQQQNIQKILDQLQNTNTTTGTTQQMRDDNTSATGINTRQTGLAAGLAGLVSLFNSPQGQAALGAGGDALTNLLKGFTGGSGGSTDPGTGLFDGLLGSAPQIPLPPGTGDYGGNPYLTGGSPNFSFNDPSIDYGVPVFADGGIVEDKNKTPEPKLMTIGDPIKSGAPNIGQLLALVGGSQSSGTSLQSLLSGAAAGAGGAGSDPLGGQGGEGASSSGGSIGTGSSNSGFSTPDGFSVTPGQAISLATALASMNPIAIAAALAQVAINSPTTSTINAPDNVDLSPEDPDAFSAMDTISVDSAAPTGIADSGTSNADASGIGIGEGIGDADGDAGDSGAGDAGSGAGDGSGDGGGSGGDGGDGGGGGWANGGVIPKQKGDGKGVKDGLTIRVSGGETILPTDVTDALGPDFMHSLISLFHTPAATQ